MKTTNSRLKTGADIIIIIIIITSIF